MADGVCAIWGTPAATSVDVPSGHTIVVSSRADGRYSYDAIAELSLLELSDDEKAKATTWLVDQRRSGELIPSLTATNIDQICAKPDLRWSARIERFFLYLEARNHRPGDRIELVWNPYESDRPKDIDGLSAWTECRTENEVHGFVQILAADGLLEFINASQKYRLTGAGFERLDEIGSVVASTDQVFVAMWFDASMTDPYEDGIRPAIETVGLRPLRIDRKEHVNKIDDEIVAEIRRSKLMIADFSSALTKNDEKTEAIARGGVYFEAGFAAGLGIPVIWSCRADCIEFVHFDTRQYNHIVWSSPSELREALENRMRALGYATV